MLQAKPGAVELVAHLKASQVPLAIATSSRWSYLFALQSSGKSKIFSVSEIYNKYRTNKANSNKISFRKVNMKKKMLNHQEMFQSFSHKVFQNQIQTSTALVYGNNSEKKRTLPLLRLFDPLGFLVDF